MVHFDEMTCMLYLDGQLDALRRGELELHMRSCTPCRNLLSALERESGFLQTAITEEFESVPAHLLAPPQPERMPWGWITSLGLASASLYWVWTLIGPYRDQMATAGFGESNLLAMLFFSAAFWKGWSDVMTAIVFLSLAVLSLPLVWFGWKNLRRFKPVAVVLAVLTAFLMLPAPAAATKIVKGDQAFTVHADETVKEDLIILTGAARIEGTVEGDLIVFSESLTITGKVTGDVIAFTRRLRVNGTVQGSVRAFANQGAFEGPIGHSITYFGESLEIAEKSTVGGSLIYFAASSDLDGKIERDVLAYVEKARINGNIGGEVRIQSNRARFGSTAQVGREIYARGHQQPEIQNSALTPKLHFTVEEKESGPDYTKPGYYWRQTLKFGSAFFFGLAFLVLLPGFYGDVLRQAKRYGPALGVGLITVIATPILSIIAIVTLVGMAVGIGGIMLWLVLYYSAQVAVGSWIGSRILGETYDTAGRIGRLALGLAIVRIAVSLPQIYFLMWCVVVVWGMGAITLALFRTFRTSMDSTEVAPMTAAPSAAPAATA